jgi:hypothetical protein
MKMFARTLVAGTFLAALPVAGAAQTPEAVRVYAGAHPYVYDAVGSIKMVVQGLGGLKPNADQAMLAEILYKTGEVLLQQVPRMPNLIAQEDVGVERLSSAQMRTVPTGRGGQIFLPTESTLTPGDWKRYEYIIQVKNEGEQGATFEESRQEAGKKDKGSTRGIGFASQWMMFIPQHLSESHFRLLGTQNVNHRQTYVVAFAQDAELVKFPGEIVTEKGSVPLLLQGVAWIDQENYRILRLRTDLLASLPSYGLQQVSSTVDFSEVKIPKFDTPLWLAKQVEILWNLNGTQMGEIHRYSGYHLFHATARIVPTD